MGKGSRPRPYSVSQNQFASNWDAIFGKKEITKVWDGKECHCHRCIKEKNLVADDRSFLPLSSTRMILFPKCGNKRCPHASDHDLECTGSNEPGQPGSVYQ
jgi:hypothetical protein